MSYRDRPRGEIDNGGYSTSYTPYGDTAISTRGGISLSSTVLIALAPMLSYPPELLFYYDNKM